METLLRIYSSFPSIILLVIVSCLFISISEARYSDGGFSIDLYHRDSPKSPLYDRSLTHSERLTKCLMRSFHRSRHFSHHLKNSGSYSGSLIADPGAYIMRIFLGTPSIETWALADTGSDLIWTQCKPCIKCFKQIHKPFDPKKSSTYQKISCNGTCETLEQSTCDSSTRKCRYSVWYGDGSYTRGDLATETLRLGPQVAFPNITIGCTHEAGGTFGSSSSGIVGLGGGKSSLISQMGSRIRGKFSYCLVDYTKHATSKMKFGISAIVHGKGVVTTPLANKQPSTFYFLTLEGISVGNERLMRLLSNQETPKNYIDEEGINGNIIIDSGTTLTMLQKELYNQVKSEVEKNIKKKTILDPEGVLDLCYSSLSKDEIPMITMHFKGGDLKLRHENTFVKISNNLICLAFAQSDGISIYGNIAQMNFLVGYDLEKKTVSFKHTNCGVA